MADVCMKMCTEPFVWLSAHLHAHIRHIGHRTFTCNWCVHVNVLLSDCLMCSITGQWAQWPMCAWKCSVSQLSDSPCTRQTLGWLHVYMHLMCACKRAGIRCLMCSCNWALGPMTDVCMKMCSEPIVWLSAHLHAHVRHSGHCTFTCTWCVHENVHWSDCPMCSCKWGVSRVTEMCMKCAVRQVRDSMHIYMHTWDTRVTARLHAPDVCMYTCSGPTVWCVHVIGQWAQRPRCAWKCAVSQLSDSLHI